MNNKSEMYLDSIGMKTEAFIRFRYQYVLLYLTLKAIIYLIPLNLPARIREKTRIWIYHLMIYQST